MKQIAHRCDLQFFVCVNERPRDHELASCHVDRGEALFKVLQAAARAWASHQGLSVWVNKSLCQGFCHADGVTVSVFPLGLRWSGVKNDEIAQILQLCQAKIVSSIEK